MFYAGIAACLTLPLSLKFIGNYFPHYQIFYYPMLALFFISGIFAVLIVRELRRMFATVLKEDCFVEENVKSLRKMGTCSFLHYGNQHHTAFIIITPATLVIIWYF